MPRADGEAKLHEARRLECEAWNARLFYGGSVQPCADLGRRDRRRLRPPRRSRLLIQCNRLNTIDLALLSASRFLPIFDLLRAA